MEELEAPPLVEALFQEGAAYIALGIEIVAVVVIAIGAVQAVVGLFKPAHDFEHPFGGKKTVWLRFGMWLLLGLEFTLAADIVRTAITPTWNDIGMLAAIAVIRTFLNYFLEHDLEKFAEPAPAEPAAPAHGAHEAARGA